MEETARATVDAESAVLKPQQILRIATDTIHSIRTENEALVPSSYIPPLDASDQRVATEHQ